MLPSLNVASMVFSSVSIDTQAAASEMALEAEMIGL